MNTGAVLGTSGRVPTRVPLIPGNRRAVALVVALSAGIMSCAPAVVATPPIPQPAPVPVPTEPTTVELVRHSVPLLVTEQRYHLESRATFDRDSAGRRDTQQQTSQADAMLRLRRSANGDLAANGRILGYSVQSGLTAKPVVIDSLRFEAVLDASTLRIVSQPPLANECDRAESGALAVIRDLLIRVPSAVTVGDTWRDSTVSVACRLNVPLVIRATNSYTLLEAARGRVGTELLIRRLTDLRVEGKSATAWRSLELTGTGSGTLEARVSTLSGAVQRLSGTSTLTLTVTDRTSPALVRTQQVTQRVTLTGQMVDR